MPTSGKLWFHVTINTLASWLPGDPRGFRDKGHRIHSSGDYKHRPPEGEHAGLHRHAQSISPPVVTIPRHLRGRVGLALVKAAQMQKHRLLVAAVGGRHGHLLVELPRQAPKEQVGEMKRAASAAVTEQMPGRLWGGGCDAEAVLTREYQLSVYQYVLDHQLEGAWVWTARDGVVFDPGEDPGNPGQGP